MEDTEIFEGSTDTERLANAKSLLESLESELIKIRVQLKRSEAENRKL
jgi:hypothetical protein